MNIVDLGILGTAGLALYSGYRRGAVMQLFSWGGFIFGMFVGGLIAPFIVNAVDPGSPLAKLLTGLGSFLGTAFIVEAIVAVGGVRIARRLRHERLQQANAIAGSVIAVTLAVLTAWFLSVPLKQNPSAARYMKESAILDALYGLMPNPPNVLAGVGRFLSHTGFPEVFAQLNPSLAPPVDPPPASLRGDREVLAAARLTYKISSEGCKGIVNGSGFPVGGDLVVTAAHVVAGTTNSQVIEPADARGRAFRGVVVYIDTDRDIAVLRVPGLEGQNLDLTSSAARRGTDGAAIGYPGGKQRTISEARVRSRTPATGRDIYSRRLVERTIYVLRARVRQGNSGGPFVDTAGNVRGMVFAASSQNSEEAYALAENEISRAIRGARGHSRQVDTKECAI
ncbi:MAG TPA: MarP family serine protease [Actinomycetota bacterium]|nr:MarP family serine protease [Actinomycetota bacterium]